MCCFRRNSKYQNIKRFRFACCRFLDSGQSYRSPTLHLRVDNATVSETVKDTCKIIWDIPTSEMWINTVEIYANWWSFPKCVRCIDGKNTEINCLAHGASIFYKKTQFLWILLQAVTDNNFERISIDVVYVGRPGDEEISEPLACIDCWIENNYIFHQIQSCLVWFQKCYLCCWETKELYCCLILRGRTEQQTW